MLSLLASFSGLPIIKIRPNQTYIEKQNART